MRAREDVTVALQPLTAQELAASPTLFASFMGRLGTTYKTVGELLEIYRERRHALDAGQDHENDLRVDRFMRDMASENWREGVVMRIGVYGEDVLMIDGIHRG